MGGMLAGMRIAHRKRRKLANAIYHHMKMSEESLNEVLAEDKMTALKEKIKSNADYMPYTSLSTWDDLTYDQVIDAMEDLSDADGEVLIYYFHRHQMLHAIAESFAADFIRTFPEERKLLLLEKFKQYGDETIRHVEKARERNMFGLWKQRGDGR